MRKFTRRTVFQTLVSLTLAVSLVACGGAGNTVSSTAPADSTSTDSTSAAAPAADAVVLRVNMSESADSNKSLAMEEVKAEIEKNTEGRVRSRMMSRPSLVVPTSSVVLRPLPTVTMAAKI